MNRSYAKARTRALPDVVLPEPRIRPAVLRLARLLSWPYLRFGLGYAGVELRHPERLVEAFRAFMSGETRLIVAFRHPFVDEPQVLGWVFLRGVQREARRLDIQLPRQPHALFVHGYEVPRWSGFLVRWLLPRMGAMPVHHAKIDLEGMARIRAVIADGPYPLTLAPEGQASYASDRVPRLEAGTMRLGFEAASNLDKAGRPEHVMVLPLSVHRQYGPKAERSLKRLVRRLEAFVGLATMDGRNEDRKSRLLVLRDELIGRAEALYSLKPALGVTPDERLATVVDSAIETGERILGISRGAGDGDGIERVYRIRQVGWDRIYVRPDPRALSALDRAVVDRRAGEAWYAMRHMELADFAWYFRTEPPETSAPLDLVIEYTQNLWDLANRLAGGAVSGRKNVRPMKAIVVAAEPIDLSKRLQGYRENRRGAASEATAALEAAYISCIEEIRRG